MEEKSGCPIGTGVGTAGDAFKRGGAPNTAMSSALSTTAKKEMYFTCLPLWMTGAAG